LAAAQAVISVDNSNRPTAEFNKLKLLIASQGNFL
jgi:hypothetical protein